MEGAPTRKPRRAALPRQDVAQSEPDRSPDGPWFVRVPVEFLDDRKNPVASRHRKMLLLLDGRCRDKSWCWIGNEEGAAEYGCTPGHFRVLLTEMAEEGILDRVIESSGKTRRFGIVLRSRVDMDLPVADTDEARRDAAEALRERTRRRKSATYRARKSATYRARKSATESESCRESDESNQTVVQKPDSRRRREDPPEPEPPGLADGPIAPPAAPPGLTPGQAEFLAGLTADQRARFDGWPEARRASTLAMFAAGLDRVILGETLKSLAPPRPDPTPPRDAPTPALIAALSGPMGGSVAARCADALLAELGDRNRGRSFGPVFKLCGQVVSEGRDPDSLAVPLARLREKMARGEAIDNPAAFWMRSVQNFDRENGGPGDSPDRFG